MCRYITQEDEPPECTCEDYPCTCESHGYKCKCEGCEADRGDYLHELRKDKKLEEEHDESR